MLILVVLITINLLSRSGRFHQVIGFKVLPSRDNKIAKSLKNFKVPNHEPLVPKIKHNKKLIQMLNDQLKQISNSSSVPPTSNLFSNFSMQTMFPLAAKEFNAKENEGIIRRLQQAGYHKSPFDHTWDETQKIPFYYYEDSIKYPNLFDICPQFVKQEEVKFHQQGDDVLFNLQARSHPWRTFNPAEAKIFIIPVFLNFIIKTKDQEYSWFTDPEKRIKLDLRGEFRHPRLYCNQNTTAKNVVDQVCRNVLMSNWFMRSSGTDHLVVNSEWRLQRFGISGPCSKVLTKIYVGSYETLSNVAYDGHKSRSYFIGRKFRCTVVVPYVDKSLLYLQPKLKTQLNFRKCIKS